MGSLIDLNQVASSVETILDLNRDSAEMGVTDNATATLIREVGTVHGIIQFEAGILTSKFTFLDGILGNITSFTDLGGGEVDATTSAPHLMSTGNIVTINGNANYNGKYIITSTGASSFKFTATFVATGTGFFTRPNSLVYSGTSGLNFHMACRMCSDSGGNARFKYEAHQNLTTLPFPTERDFKTNEYGAECLAKHIILNNGDIVWLGIVNTNNISSATPVHGSLHLDPST
jgi:hypothetical protein